MCHKVITSAFTFALYYFEVPFSVFAFYITIYVTTGIALSFLHAFLFYNTGFFQSYIPNLQKIPLQMLPPVPTALLGTL